MAAKSLVIVESPAKAKTINKILGTKFVVKACMGHVRDLPQKKFGIDVEHDFEPEYRVIPTRKETVAELKSQTKKSAAVYLAPDPDREGEAIAWHLLQALKIPEEKAFRVVFNEITPKAVLDAFKSPGKISMERVNAQQARRVLDRIVGYKLSPLLWKKVARGLSAGRVQSVAAKLVVDREREILAFKADEYWTIQARLSGAEPKARFLADLRKFDGKEPTLSNAAASQAVLDALRGVPYVVKEVAKKEKKDEPSSPFTTSLLQQQASVRLHFATKRAMRIAQQLYEGVELGAEGSVGLITYMRTDSVRISDDAMAECRAFIPAHFGPDYLNPTPRTFKSRKGAQEAHESIRPTSVARVPEQIQQYLTEEQFRLYRLIWRRFVATQMTPARYLVSEAMIEAGRALFLARGRELLFNGHTIVSGHTLKKDEQILPTLTAGQPLTFHELLPTQHFTQPPPRFTEASLVKALEKFGIGRPSTYAPIISTIQERGYVRQEERRLYATDLGMIVTDKLVISFADIMNTEFTSQLEEKLDLIEEAKSPWVDVLREFYVVFMKDLDRAVVEMDSEKGQADESAPPCEKCGKPMLKRWNKRGAFLGCSGYPDCKSTRSMTPPQVTDQTCEKCNKPFVIKFGRNGRFMACSGYPECKNTRSVFAPKGEKGPIITIDEKCDKCGAPLVIRSGRRGKFLACSAYPNCKNTKPLPKVPKTPESLTGEGEAGVTARPSGEAAAVGVAVSVPDAAGGVTAGAGAVAVAGAPSPASTTVSVPPAAPIPDDLEEIPDEPEVETEEPS
ncbi:MAG: type I DNA topoisomerase [Planctomycetes bacterium]|nr:type I DNA topoisomerase [Planctomycetota bacterium]